MIPMGVKFPTVQSLPPNNPVVFLFTGIDTTFDTITVLATSYGVNWKYHVHSDLSPFGLSSNTTSKTLKADIFYSMI